ncbi:hypothetical protein Hdeb2414_s0006g00210551 [Helianthus debilis subsp. tardiflorus]
MRAKFSICIAAIPGMCAKFSICIAAIPGMCAKISGGFPCTTSLAVSIGDLPLTRSVVRNSSKNVSTSNHSISFPTPGIPCLGKSVNSPWFARYAKLCAHK